MGARHLTLDAVAREAGVSKGGLLYHFPSKEALLSAMVESFCGRLTEAAPVDRSNSSKSPALLRDLIHHQLLTHSEKGDLRTAHGMIAAVAERPSLLDPITSYNCDLWARVKESPNSEKAILSWLAVEGLLFLEIFNTSPFNAGEREKIIERIFDLLNETEHQAEPVSTD